MPELRVGQRWIRQDGEDINVIEVTNAGAYCRGRVVQLIKGYVQVGREDSWGFINTGSVKYTYLEGQDRPPN
jgi:hypothetical protein